VQTHEVGWEIRQTLRDVPKVDYFDKLDILTNACDGGSDDTMDDKAESVVSEGVFWVGNTPASLVRFGDLKCLGVETFSGTSRSYKTATELRSS
jgi:hypothetical protein